MRHVSLALVLAMFAITGCGGSNNGGGGGAGGTGGGGTGGTGGGGTGGSGGGGTGGTGGSGGGGGVDPNGTPAFEITNPNIMVSAGQEVTYCYYFHTSNTQTVAINKWVSAMTPGSHHMIMFLNPGGSQPADGTVDQNCGVGGGGGSNVPVWTYATQTATQEIDLPPDDGAGKPLAQNIAPGSAGYFQMHYLNATQGALMVHVDLKAYALPANASYTQTDAYVTYNNDISIGPGKTGVVVSASCPVPAGVKFWTMSTHSHKQSVGTEVLDGSNMIFSATDWEHPGSHDWNAAPFYTFSATKLTWQCTYDNTGSNKGSTIVAGPSAQTNEMCMATGYFFPATGPKFGYVTGGNCIGL